FVVSAMKPYVYKIEAWVDRFGTWRRDLQKRYEAGQDIAQELLVGAALVEEAARAAPAAQQKALLLTAETLKKDGPVADRVELALNDSLRTSMLAHSPRLVPATHDVGQRIWVD